MPRYLSRVLLPALAILVLGCAASTRYGSGNGKEDCCLEEGRRIAERFKVDHIKTRRFTHTELWAALDPILTINATGMFLHPANAMLTEQKGQRWLQLSAVLNLAIKRGPEPSSSMMREIHGN